MKRFLAVLIFPFAISCCTTAYATPIGSGTYYLEDAYVDGYAVTGQVVFNSAGDATGVNLSFLDTAFSSTPTRFNTIGQTNTYSSLGQAYFTASGSPGGQIALYFDDFTDSQGNYDLCIGNATCGTSGSADPSTLQQYGYNVSGPPYYISGFGPDQFTSGYLSSVAPTPEPSSLVLLGSAILGCAGLVRRRMVKA